MARPPLAALQKVEVSRVVIDAGIAIKRVVEEDGTAHALALRSAYSELLAPDPLVPECANVLWKKGTRGELAAVEAQIAARLLAKPHSAAARMTLVCDGGFQHVHMLMSQRPQIAGFWPFQE